MAVDDSYTVSLLHFDNNFTDESGKTWTANGGAATSATQKKFGSEALYLPSSSAYLYCVNNTDLRFGSADFSCDFQFNPSSLTDGWIFNFGNEIFWSRTVSIKLASGKIVSRVKKDSDAFWTDTVSATTLSVGTFYHVAVSRSSGIYRLFINGVLEATNNAPGNTDSPDSHNTIGGRYDNGSFISESARGYIDELRISKGIARWTANFTPPTAPYGQIFIPHAIPRYIK